MLICLFQIIYICSIIYFVNSFNNINVKFIYPFEFYGTLVFYTFGQNFARLFIRKNLPRFETGFENYILPFLFMTKLTNSTSY